MKNMDLSKDWLHLEKEFKNFEKFLKYINAIDVIKKLYKNHWKGIGGFYIIKIAIKLDFFLKIC